MRRHLTRIIERGFATAEAKELRIQKVAADIYFASTRPWALDNSNAAIFVNSSDVLVVDAHSHPAAAAALIAQIKNEVTSKPVRWLVNTHFHWDHTQGNRAYLSTGNQVDVVASNATKPCHDSPLMARIGSSHRARRAAQVAGHRRGVVKLTKFGSIPGTRERSGDVHRVPVVMLLVSSVEYFCRRSGSANVHSDSKRRVLARVEDRDHCLTWSHSVELKKLPRTSRVRRADV